jgi:crossover junction endodeoxyribonuclease RuvC
MSKEKIILGIDPGSRIAGFAVVKSKGKKIDFIDSGVMKYNHIDEFIQRLGEIYNSCEHLVNLYHPDEIAFESLIYVKSATALSKLAQARGAMIAAFLRSQKASIYEYSPNLVKSSVVGHGHADKKAIQKGLELIFKNQKMNKFTTHDESDALAIAVCHALNSHGGNKSYLTGSGKGNSLKSLGEAIAKRKQL